VLNWLQRQNCSAGANGNMHVAHAYNRSVSETDSRRELILCDDAELFGGHSLVDFSTPPTTPSCNGRGHVDVIVTSPPCQNDVTTNREPVRGADVIVTSSSPSPFVVEITCHQSEQSTRDDYDTKL